ncbi:MAG: prolyl-tRNA synthetase associated domain-containing protein [Firmicutes bacterium]|nr:prolyl-tRNA synthetase associated domain-containing protein [Bacillota bacterium]
MNKQEIYDELNKAGISFEITEHPAVWNMEDVAQLEMPHPEADAKNLFVREDKTRNYYLITVKGDKRVDLKALRKEEGLRQLKFASAEELAEVLGLYAGAVTPLGLLNDESLTVTLIIDSYFLQPPALIGAHPNDNTATVWLKTEDLLWFLRSHGNEVLVRDLPYVPEE